jgi:type IV pilus assembly protein PilW
MNRHSAARPAFAGFTLVETMVAIVIGMLATFIVMQVYATSEGSKRTISGGADAQSDAAVALYLIERDLRQAGYGLSPNPEDFVPAYTAPADGGVLTNGVLALCTTVSAHNTKRGDFTYASSTLAPVVINPAGYPAGDADTDVVLVNYGTSSGAIGQGVKFTNPTGEAYLVGGGGSRAGFMRGDLVLAVPAPGVAQACTIAEITGLPTGIPGNDCIGDASDVSINHENVAYPSFYTGCDPGNLTTAAWNKGGVGSAYVTVGAASPRLYNLGPVGSFVSRVYAVRKGNLTMCDVTVNDCTAAVADPPDPAIWTPIATDVVGLKAQYGKDSDFNGLINSWDANPPVGLVPPAQVVAVRLALVVRSGQYEKEIVTTAAPVWHSDATGTADVNFDLTGLGIDWDHYRYKTAQSIVPVRNLIWGQQNPI